MPIIKPNLDFEWLPANLNPKILIGLSATITNSLQGVSHLMIDEASQEEEYDFIGMPDMLKMEWPNLTGVGNNILFRLANSPKLAVVSLPKLQAANPGPSSFPLIFENLALFETLLAPLFPDETLFSFSGCPSLNKKIISTWQPTDGQVITLTDITMEASVVNFILAAGVANAGYVSGGILLNGVGPAAPTGQGLIDKATLQGRGVAVLTN